MVAPGVLTFGLSAGPSAMILGKFGPSFGGIEIIVKPKPERGGKGAYGTGTAVPPPDRSWEKEYDVIFVISFKDRHWTEKITVKETGLSSITHIIAILKKATSFVDRVAFKISLIGININTLYVKLLKAKVSTTSVDVVHKENNDGIS